MSKVVNSGCDPRNVHNFEQRSVDRWSYDSIVSKEGQKGDRITRSSYGGRNIDHGEQMNKFYVGLGKRIAMDQLNLSARRWSWKRPLCRRMVVASMIA